jgi:hypothetical protein
MMSFTLRLGLNKCEYGITSPVGQLRVLAGRGPADRALVNAELFGDAHVGHELFSQGLLRGDARQRLELLVIGRISAFGPVVGVGRVAFGARGWQLDFCCWMQCGQMEPRISVPHTRQVGTSTTSRVLHVEFPVMLLGWYVTFSESKRELVARPLHPQSHVEPNDRVRSVRTAYPNPPPPKVFVRIRDFWQSASVPPRLFLPRDTDDT